MDATLGRATLPALGQPRIGEMLLAEGLITEQELAAALDVQRHTGRRIGETLVELRFLSSFDLARVLARRLGLPFLDLTETPVNAMTARRVPEELARRYRAVPVTTLDGVIVIGMVDPGDVFAIDDIRVFVDANVTAAVVDPEQLDQALNSLWAASLLAGSVGDAADTMIETVEDSGPVLDSDEAPIVRLAEAIVTQAVDERASDVHIEPSTDHVRIRFRIDGVLTDASEAPLSVLRPLISRLKVVAGADITNTRAPQDGRFSAMIRDRAIEVRLTTLPTAAGEAAVLRLLDKSHGVLTLDSLGLTADEETRYARAFHSSQGLILASGPTGSGKTTTLYATLLELNTVERSIISVEDPIEYRVDGLKQLQVSARGGVGFATVLRSILRADPDVILIGEVRDAETARIAAEAALTGHLVLSSIHTTSAAAVPLRLMDMGIEPFLVTSALSCVVAQRLVRELCASCATPDRPDPVVRDALGIPDELVEAGAIRRAVGCPRCAHTGYRGRFALYEILTMSEDIRGLVAAHAPVTELRRWAVAEGMETLRAAGLRNVAEGRLSIDEFLRVLA